MDNTYSHVFWDNWITEDELTRIENYFDAKELKTAEVINLGSQDVDTSIRDSKTSMVFVDRENEWIFAKLMEVAERVNNEFYQFDLYGFESVQYTVYDNPGSNYDFHIDMQLGRYNNLETKRRKLSFSLILSDSSDYTGGEFEIMHTPNQIQSVEQKRGRILAFPSWIQHRVAPIKSGVRKSIVFWVLGPKFK